MQVERSKLVIRDCIKYCEEAQGDRSIPADKYDADGELDAADIFCAKCIVFDSFEVALDPARPPWTVAKMLMICVVSLL